MSAHNFVTGLFKDEDRAVLAIRELAATTWTVRRVHSPIPSHKVAEALHLKKSRVGYFTLAGGILGFLSGFALAIFTASRWSLIVSGKPVVALIPFVIVGFEFTILFAVLGNVVGMIAQTGLPRLKDLEFYDPRCSGEHFGVVASCTREDRQALVEFMRARGATVDSPAPSGNGSIGHG